MDKPLHFSRQDRKLFGVPAQQNPEVAGSINPLLMCVEPNSIIEFGTGYGGITSLFAVYSLYTGCKVDSFDIKLPSAELRKIAACCGIHLHVVDIFSNIELVSSLISQSQGRLLLVCDNGDKVREFNTFAPFLRPQDVVMVHDYFEDKNDCKGDECCEIVWNDVANTVESLNFGLYMYEQMRKYRWLCLVKQS